MTLDTLDHMINRHLRVAGLAAAITVVASGLTGCGSPAPAESVAASHSAEPTPSATPSATPEPTPDPLLIVSGTVADAEGQSLALTLTTTSVRPPTDQDRADYAASRCGLANPAFDPFANPDTRVVTLAVESLASAGFSGWTDARGIVVTGSLYSGPIWEAEAHGSDPCYRDSRVTRPGTGEARVIASSTDWNLENAVVGDGAITLTQYGFNAQTVDAMGQPTGLTAVADCAATPSPEFDDLALSLWSGRWGANNNLPEYCFYGRGAGD